MQFIIFIDEFVIDYLERFILVLVYIIYFGEYLLKGMFVRFINYSDFFFCFVLILFLIFWFLLNFFNLIKSICIYISWKICILKYFKYSIQNIIDYMIILNRFLLKLIWFYLFLLGVDEEEGVK